MHIITENPTCLMRRKMFGTRKIYRSIDSIAEDCPECTAAGKNLKTILRKNQLGNIPEQEEPNESVQLDFWGPINYLNESQYVLVAVDRFSPIYFENLYNKSWSAKENSRGSGYKFYVE